MIIYAKMAAGKILNNLLDNTKKEFSKGKFTKITPIIDYNFTIKNNHVNQLNLLNF
jgi:Na+-transporting NADH:ubiquinone oxidoreductase subunit NqrB